ncbi:PAS domain S-box protein [Desulfonatronum lacustre]|uniref:PAS domain S-box protein n=1 Tax=Desulfonatronum lacustre TaxID=66849 RepID=UPI001B7FA9EA|nr:PAS domain S-box protein [Desulfonatronum lacustre]
MRYLRLLKGMTQAELAGKVGLSVKHIGRIERGEAVPSFPLIPNLAQTLGTTPLDFFLHFEQIPSPTKTLDASFQVPTSNSYAKPCFAIRLATWALGGPSLKPFWSESLYALLGYAPFSVSPTVKRFLKHVRPSRQEAVARFLEATRHGQADSGMLVEIVTRHDQERTLMLNPDTFRPSLQDPPIPQLVVQDVTDCVALNQTVTLRQGELEAYVLQKNQDISEVAGKFKLEAEQRRQAEKGLRIFEQMVDSSHDAQAFIDADGVIIAVNRQYEKLAGLSADEIEGRQWSEYLIDYWGREDFGGAMRSRAEKALAGEEQGSFHEWRIYRGGRRRYVHVIFTPCRKNGDVAGVVVTVHDLTYFMEIHERLGARERLLQQMLETANEGIVLVDAEQRITFGNAKIGELVGHGVEDLVGTKALDHLHPEELERTHAEIANLRSGKDIRYTTRLIHETGREIWVLISASPIFTDQGQYKEALIMLINLTELKNAEAALERKTRELDAFFMESLDLMIVCTEDGSIIRLNQAWERILGWPPDDFMGLRYLNFLHPEDVESVKRLFMELPEKKHIFSFIERYRARNSEWRTIEWHCQHLEGYIFGTGRDITEKVAMERKLLDNRLLMSAAERVARFGAWSVDLATNKVTLSGQAAAIHGMPEGYAPTVEEAMDFYPGVWREKIAETFGKCVREGTSFDEMMEFVTRQGQRIWIRTRGEAVRDESGVIVRVEGALQDITSLWDLLRRLE